MKELYKFPGGSFALLTLSLFFSSPVFSQRTLTARSNTIVDSFVHGFYESLPASYGTSGSKKYPLLVFLHGQGEIGDGSPTSLPAVLLDGPVKQLNQQVNYHVNANFPDPVTVNGQSFEFIVIAPQLNTWPWNGYEQRAVNDMINYAISHYRVDTSKMYLTGMSMGGGIAWEYPGYSAVFAKRLAGLLVVAGASSPSSYRAAEIVKEHLPVWATANSVDNTVPTSYTTDYVALLNAAGANPAPLITIFPDVGHGGWLKTYGYVNQPGVVQNGLNVYQWMLQYKRVGDNVVLDNGGTVPGPPVSSAGADQTITLPTSSVTLTGSGSETNGTITGYQWTQVSGPNTAAFANAKAAQTAVSSLVAGAYVFQLTVTDNSGKTASDQVKITVNAAPPTSVFTVSAGPDKTISLPTNSIKLTGVATVQGETVATCQWRQVSGPSTATIAGGGSISPTMSGLTGGVYIFAVTLTSVSGKSASDQMQVTVNAFIANAGPDVSITLPTSSWKIAGIATVKGQGVASCKWKEVSGPSTAVISGGGSITPTVSSLVAGAYVFQVDLVSTTGATSSDQMKLTVNTATAASIEAAGLISDSVDGRPTLRVYPNPVQADQQFIVEGQGLTAGTVKFMLYDINGRLVKESIQKTQSSYFLQTIPVVGLVRGIYVLTVVVDGKKPRNFTLLIQ